ncbi:hypothetical protein FGO68_gene15029 [Halteria grandinella]|uniref:Uncharacterized protein n=1 Tax=Halteria grandinella TaxID=5974 RepID=A0A8J8SUW3_HALGN|nr:hypothetical protein FGO68_gene15029 [Halteria grandinella]
MNEEKIDISNRSQVKAIIDTWVDRNAISAFVSAIVVPRLQYVFSGCFRTRSQFLPERKEISQPVKSAKPISNPQARTCTDPESILAGQGLPRTGMTPEVRKRLVRQQFFETYRGSLRTEMENEIGPAHHVRAGPS